MLQKIRNLTVRHLPSGTLFPHEVTQYDPWVIRETLHNCIAHQDYVKGGKITVVETPETLLFTNLGSFIPGTVEQMAQAMVNLNMIDTIGSGTETDSGRSPEARPAGSFKRMFLLQRERSFPMPGLYSR